MAKKAKDSSDIEIKTIWEDRFIERTYEAAGYLAKRFNLKNYRLHPEVQRSIVEGSLDKLGWIGEVKIARDPETGKEVMFDGHLRVTAALLRAGEECEIPSNWYSLSEDEANQALMIHDTSTSMAEIDFEILDDLIQSTPPMEIPEFDDWLVSIFEAGDAAESPEEEDEVKRNYSRKIISPEYVPTGEKPELEQLFDTTRTMAIIEAIEQDENITPQEKEFLKIAAQRHTVLHFENIAEYYSHADEPMQSLMEDNALVIIDFGKAISQGLVQITEELQEMVLDEYGD